MARSPIEMMIDKACGFDLASAPKIERIMLKCPHCGRTSSAPKDETDPQGTARVEVSCPDCTKEGDRPQMHYYDSSGQWFNGEKFVHIKQPR